MPRRDADPAANAAANGAANAASAANAANAANADTSADAAAHTAADAGRRVQLQRHSGAVPRGPARQRDSRRLP